MLERTKAVLKPRAMSVSKKVITLEVNALERLVPDKLLLLYVNTLDKHVPPKAIDGIINGLEKLPPKVRSSIITAADHYIPDAVASSRKASAVISAVYKYVPDKAIPPESIENWAHLKVKFHIPTLLSRQSKR